MCDEFCLAEHLVFGDPKCGLRDAAGEVVDFDAVELRERDADHVALEVDDGLVADDLRESLVFQTAEEDVSFREEVARAAGGGEEGKQWLPRR